MADVSAGSGPSCTAHDGRGVLRVQKWARRPDHHHADPARGRIRAVAKGGGTAAHSRRWPVEPSAKSTCSSWRGAAASITKVGGASPLRRRLVGDDPGTDRRERSRSGPRAADPEEEGAGAAGCSCWTLGAHAGPMWLAEHATAWYSTVHAARDGAGRLGGGNARVRGGGTPGVARACRYTPGVGSVPTCRPPGAAHPGPGHPRPAYARANRRMGAGGRRGAARSGGGVRNGRGALQWHLRARGSLGLRGRPLEPSRR